jgi:hypothetical protein
MLKILRVVTASLVLGTMASTAAHAAPACTSAEVERLPEAPFRDHAKPFTRARIAYPFGSRSDYGFDLQYIVDAAGHVTCVSVETEPGHAPDITPQRQAAIDQTAAAVFTPFIVDGRPAAVYIDEFIQEEQLPKNHVAPPGGDLATAHIHQDWRQDMVPEPESYSLDIYGDGRVVYEAVDDDVIGRQTYMIPPETVQALLDKAADIDFWSYDDEAMRSPVRLIHRPLMGTRIDYAGRSQSLGYVSDLFGGQPDSLGGLQSAIGQAAHIAWWKTLPSEALDHLQKTGFDFKGPAGGNLLTWALKHNLPEETLDRLIALGTPVIWSKPAYDGRVSGPLTAALEAKRPALAAKMIDAGALLLGGLPDRPRVNSAFIAALRGCSLDAVKLILPYKPDLDAPDVIVGNKRASVAFWLGCNENDADSAAVAESVLTLGAPVAARDAENRSLLSDWAIYRSPAAVKVLLDHGAAPNALDDDDRPPLAETWREETALLLLAAGADPRRLNGGYDRKFYANIASNHWTRVQAWLEAHGFGDWLKAQHTIYYGPAA